MNILHEYRLLMKGFKLNYSNTIAAEKFLGKIQENVDEIKKLKHENHLLKSAIDRLGGGEIMKEINEQMIQWIKENKRDL